MEEDVFDRFISYIKQERLRQIGIDAVGVTHKERERNPNVTLSIIIKSQGKRGKEEGKKYKNNQKTMNKYFFSHIIMLHHKPTMEYKKNLY